MRPVLQVECVSLLGPHFQGVSRGKGESFASTTFGSSNTEALCRSTRESSAPAS
jgi:hypothetical protein